jgi:hypothetical protein
MFVLTLVVLECAEHFKNFWLKIIGNTASRISNAYFYNVAWRLILPHFNSYNTLIGKLKCIRHEIYKNLCDTFLIIVNLYIFIQNIDFFGKDCLLIFLVSRYFVLNKQSYVFLNTLVIKEFLDIAEERF